MEKAETIFENNNGIRSGGVILALPSLLMNGLLKHLDTTYKLPKGFYGINHIFITLAFLVLLRVKTLEQTKNYSPGELGKIIGLDRIPEVKTLRNKLSSLSDQKNAKEWQNKLSKDWMELHPELAGLLYIDGHKRAYYGNLTKLPKKYMSRERLCLRGMSDFWLNDALGQPFFVLTTPLNPGLIEILEKEVIGKLIKDVPDQPSEEELKMNTLLHRFAVIFDREGYSPKFIKKMWEKFRIACYTYHKYPKDKWNKEEFKEQEVKLRSGEIVTMKLAERGSLIGSKKGEKVWVREIRKLTDSGHQTSIITTDFINPTHKIAVNMFALWSQENFFKYMIQDFGIDRLVEYGTMELDATTEVINPRYRNIESKIRSLAAKKSRQLSKFGKGELELSSIEEEKDEKKRIEKIEKYMIVKAELLEDIELIGNELEELKITKKETKHYITIDELPPAEKFETLVGEKKHIMDLVKMIAYRAETAMSIAIKPFMSKPDESRTVLKHIFQTDIDMEVIESDKILKIKLHSLPNEQENKIAKKLCEFLNQSEMIYPDTDLLVFYEMVA